MKLKRYIFNEFTKKIKPNRVLLLLGARRVGKTELIKAYLATQDTKNYILLNGESYQVQEQLQYISKENYLNLLGNKRLLVIDEAQKIKNIGAILKFIVDEIANVKVIATGSSVFDLTNKLGEPLVGRKTVIQLFPFAQIEYSTIENGFETKEKLAHRLVYGSYPELLHLDNNMDKQEYLNELVNDYLLKDILEFDGIRNASKIKDLLRLIAFQIGKEVSYNELSKTLGIHKNTVEKYLDLLTKVFVIYKVSGFSRNLRKEIRKSNRYYFYDNGIRNTLINNFNPLHIRNDVGELWENYILSERIKYLNYNKIQVNYYFWRTYQQQEIDWIEEKDGNLFATELKWNEHKKVKIPSAYKEAYPQSKFQVINKQNYLSWIT